MTTPASHPPGQRRIADLDVARAVALIGVVVVNYHGYLIIRGASIGQSFPERVFDPWHGVLATRFAAVFVLVAGMGISLLTRRSRASAEPLAQRIDRWVLLRRGTLLYGAGYVLDWIWNGTILFYYGAFFVVGAFIFALRLRWLVAIGTSAALAAAGIQWWVFERERDGHSTSWLTYRSVRSPRGLLFDTFVNGTHPLLPWLAFLCAGVALGRFLPLTDRRRVAVGALGVAVLAATYAMSHWGQGGPLRNLLLSTGPLDRGLLYTVGALASSMSAFCLIGWIVERSASSTLTRSLANAGRTTLTIYVLHILVFNAAVDWYALVKPTGLDTALLFAGVFWIVVVAAAAQWQRHLGMGPLERVYRRFGA